MSTNKQTDRMKGHSKSDTGDCIFFMKCNLFWVNMMYTDIWSLLIDVASLFLYHFIVILFNTEYYCHFRWHVSILKHIWNGEAKTGSLIFCMKIIQKRLYETSYPPFDLSMANIRASLITRNIVNLPHAFDLWPWPLTLTANLTVKYHLVTHLGYFCLVWCL